MFVGNSYTVANVKGTLNESCVLKIHCLLLFPPFDTPWLIPWCRIKPLKLIYTSVMLKGLSALSRSVATYLPLFWHWVTMLKSNFGLPQNESQLIRPYKVGESWLGGGWSAVDPTQTPISFSLNLWLQVSNPAYLTIFFLMFGVMV